MKQIFKLVKRLFTGILVVAAIIFAVKAGPTIISDALDGIGTYFNNQAGSDTSSSAMVTVEKTVTEKEAKSRLKDIGAVITEESDYTFKKSLEESAKLKGHSIPGTKTKCSFSCIGKVQVGYDTDDIGVEVDDKSGTITVILPEAEVFSNDIDADSISYMEKNNIIRDVDEDQQTALQQEAEAFGLKDAASKGIYSKAKENAEELITDALSGFDGYAIVFA